MGLPVQEQAKYWGIATIALFAALWVLGDVIMPFLIGGAIAYFLDPVADALERMGFTRAASVAIITSCAIVLFIVIALAVIPTLVYQSLQLFETAPELFARLRDFIADRFPSVMNENSQAREALSQLGSLVQSKGGELVNSLLTSARSVISVVTLLVIAPVVAVYLLYDWDHMIERVDELLPRDHAPIVRKLAGQIDKTLASFIRGMGTVCLILGTYYAVALMLVGLNFGLVVGFIAGLLTFIPYLGALLGGALAIGLALFQFWGDWVSIGLVAGIFALGQVAEGNFLTPKLVGSSVGLHPVWLIFALSVFGALFGFVGMLVAVPLAAALGVLVRYGIERYKTSRLYRGFAEQDDA